MTRMEELRQHGGNAFILGGELPDERSNEGFDELQSLLTVSSIKKEICISNRRIGPAVSRNVFDNGRTTGLLDMIYSGMTNSPQNCLAAPGCPVKSGNGQTAYRWRTYVSHTTKEGHPILFESCSIYKPQARIF